MFMLTGELERVSCFLDQEVRRSKTADRPRRQILNLKQWKPNLAVAVGFAHITTW
jgi:hypothetical protein